MATDEPLMAGVAGRYASALFDLATEQNLVAEVEVDLATFQTLCDESPDMLGMVRSPVIPSAEQSLALTAVMVKAGAGALTVNFFKLLAKNRRLFAAGDMAKAFGTLAAKSRGQVSAEVTSASPLSDAHTAQLRETLKASVGKDVTLMTKVDPSILGGLIVKLGSRMVDSSLRTKLDTMTAVLKSGG